MGVNLSDPSITWLRCWAGWALVVVLSLVHSGWPNYYIFSRSFGKVHHFDIQLCHLLGHKLYLLAAVMTSKMNLKILFAQMFS